MVRTPSKHPVGVDSNDDMAFYGGAPSSHPVAPSAAPHHAAAKPAQRRLHELDFMDIYVCLDGDGKAHFRPRVLDESGSLDVDVPPQFHEDVERLTALLRREFTGVEKGLTYDGVRLRAAKLETAGGKIWAAMRRINDRPPTLDKLGFIPQLAAFLRTLGKRDGLTLICGATGNGKTTTSSSLLLDFLNNYGGVAFTIEDPVEYCMEGRQGKAGYCYQSEVREESEWGMMLKRALRWHPRYIFVGEIRTPDAANQLLRAATSGHNVLATMHAGSMEEALEGLLQLAEVELGERAPMLLAAGLAAIVHQNLTTVGISASFMVTEPDNSGSPIRALIRERRIGQTRSIADQQMALLTRTGKVFSIR
jgi:Tfp pilus assembly pilus retraction ATPase PilT